MISKNFREQLEEGSPSYTFYSIEKTSRILTTEEINIFKHAFDKRHQQLSSGSFSRTFTSENHMPKNFEYAATSQTFLYQRGIVDLSAPVQLTDEDALLIAAASEKQAQEFFENSRLERLETLIKNYGTYLTDADRTVLARQKSPIYNAIPAEEEKKPIPVLINYKHEEYAPRP